MVSSGISGLNGSGLNATRIHNFFGLSEVGVGNIRILEPMVLYEKFDRLTLLDSFMKEDVGRVLDMRIPSSRLVWNILTQINLRGKK